MKILVIQLTRLGDIYLTWPVLRSLQRRHPAAEIHLLVRRRFVGAAEGLEGVHVHSLDFKDILAPLIDLNPKVDEAVQGLRSCLEDLKKNEFDEIINVTFSPFSASLSTYLTGGKTPVRGYSRHIDGTLKLGDEFSRYFYAQGGRERWSRIHLTRLFASVAGVDLIDEDWAPPSFVQIGPRNGICVQLAGSESHKSLSDVVWISLLKSLREVLSEPITLIGGNAEQEIAERIEMSLPDGAIENRVGKTSLAEAFALVAKARFFIGPDSMGIHMATLTGTPVVNVSSASVNFHETGPLSEVCYVIPYQDEVDLLAGEVVDCARALLQNVPFQGLGVWKRRQNFLSSTECYEQASFENIADEEFSTAQGLKAMQWELCQAIYFEGSLTMQPGSYFQQALVELHEMNKVILDCLTRIEQGTPPEKMNEILRRSDEVIQAISQIVPLVAPLVNRLYAERVDIPPTQVQEIVRQTKVKHEIFQAEVEAVWSLSSQSVELEAK